MMLVLLDDQLEVILPSLSEYYETSSHLMHVVVSNHIHPMQTISKSGIIQPRQFLEFSSFIAQLRSIPKLDTPSHFKAALGKPEWHQAIFEEIQALK